MIRYKGFRKPILLGCLLAVAPGPVARGAEPVTAATYYLACIRINDQDRRYIAYQDNRVEVYPLDAQGQLLAPPVHILNASATRITRDGRIVSASRVRPFLRLASTDKVGRGRIEALRKGDRQANRAELVPEVAALNEGVAWASVVEYLKAHSLYDPTVHREPTRSSLSLEMDALETRVSPTGEQVVICVGIQEKNPKANATFAPNHDILFLVDFATSTVHHICGSDTDRWFCRLSGDSLCDGKVTFYRTRNYLSIMTHREQDTPERLAEGGWEVCCYDVAARRLDVLAKSPFRAAPDPGRLLWSPDGTKLLYCASPAPPSSGKVNTSTGWFVYDANTKTSSRPMNKPGQEVAICWAPDSRRYLSWRRPSPHPPEAADPGAFYVVDLNGDHYPLLRFDEQEVSGEGLLVSRHTFRWSPDGKYVAFCARFSEDGNEYDGLFVMPDDRTGRYRLLDKARIQPKVEGRGRIVEYFHNPVWLTAD